jgi:hypothetical protein
VSRVVIIGNSHAAAFKDGWEALRDRRPGVDVAFFALVGHKFDQLEPDAGYVLRLRQDARETRPALLTALEQINGRTEIDLSEADHVLWVGREQPLAVVADVLGRFDVDGLREAGAGRQMSRAAFEAICDALADTALPGPEWRGWRHPRLTLLPRHAPAETWLDENGASSRPWGPLAKNPDGVAEALDVWYARLAARLEAVGISMLRQPVDTLAPCGLTLAALGRGSRRLRGPAHPAADVIHMNADFGARCLDAFLARLGSAARATAFAQN